MTATETAPSTPDEWPPPGMAIGDGGDASRVVVHGNYFDDATARLTLQAERAAQEIERRETRPRSWRRPRSWF